MNIGYDFRMGGPKHGGIGRYAEELLFAMLELDKANKYYIIYNDSINRNTYDKLELLPHTELIYSHARHYGFEEQILLPKLLKALPLDVTFFPNFNHPVLFKGNFVVTIHDMVHHKISGHKLKNRIYFYGYKYIMGHACRASRAIVTPSLASKQEISEIFPECEEKIEVVYEGISLKAQPDSLTEKIKKDFLIKRPYFLFVGTLERKKNILGLAKGFDRLIEKHNLDVDLVFAGKPDKHYPNIKHQVLELKSSNRIVFTGYIKDEDLSALYRGAHLYVNASEHEGFGLPGVEAMQFGLPLAVSNTPVFNEIYDDAAVYFDPRNPEDIAEKLYLLATDKKYYELKSKSAAERSQFFSWDKAALETLAILKSSAGLLETIPASNQYSTENS